MGGLDLIEKPFQQFNRVYRLLIFLFISPNLIVFIVCLLTFHLSQVICGRIIKEICPMIIELMWLNLISFN